MKIAVVGAGASGLFFAANCKNDITVFDSNKQPGKKLLLTGGGRCNFTNNCDKNQFFEHLPRGDRFARSALSLFSQNDVVDWFATRGVESKCEDGRFFPKSDRAETIVNCLVEACKNNGAKFVLGKPVQKIEKSASGFLVDGRPFDVVVLATGGKFFDQTGSTGKGFDFSKRLGLETFGPYAALCPVVANVPANLQGVSVFAGVTLQSAGKTVCKTQGNVLFAHFGLTGPAILNATAWVGDNKIDWIRLSFVSKTQEEICQFVELQKSKHPKQNLKTTLAQLVPAKLGEFVLENAGVQNCKLCDLKKQDLIKICSRLLNTEFDAKTKDGQSMVTCGGVCTKEINPKTMQSKIENLYVIGELLDVHGETGGFNLQIAWSTAYAAAKALERK